MGKDTCQQNWNPESNAWEPHSGKRTNSQKLSFDLHMSAMEHVQTPIIFNM